MLIATRPSPVTSRYGIPARSAASIRGGAVSANGPAQLITASVPAIARSSDPGMSTVAILASTPGWAAAAARSFASSRPDSTGVHPRRTTSAVTNRAVCP